MIGDATSARVMTLDVEISAVVQQTIENVRCLTCGGGDHLGIERRVSIGDVGVEGDRRLGALVGIDRACRRGTAIERKMLTVRAG